MSNQFEIDQCTQLAKEALKTGVFDDLHDYISQIPVTKENVNAALHALIDPRAPESGFDEKCPPIVSLSQESRYAVARSKSIFKSLEFLRRLKIPDNLILIYILDIVLSQNGNKHVLIELVEGALKVSSETQLQEWANITIDVICKSIREFNEENPKHKLLAIFEQEYLPSNRVVAHCTLELNLLFDNPSTSDDGLLTVLGRIIRTIADRNPATKNLIFHLSYDDAFTPEKGGNPQTSVQKLMQSWDALGEVVVMTAEGQELLSVSKSTEA